MNMANGIPKAMNEQPTNSINVIVIMKMTIFSN